MKKPEIQDEPTITDLPTDSYCKVTYSKPKPKYAERIEAFDGSDIVERSIRYFLPFFLSGDMPELKFFVDDVEFEARAHFNELFKTDVEESVSV